MIVNNHDTSRRDFLRATGGVIGAAWIGVQWTDIAAAAEHAHEAAAGSVDHEFKVLTPAQARDVEAIASQIVPSGNTPGAREAGAVYFIDHVNAGIYARNAPEFLAGLDAFQQEFAKSHAGAGQFADLDAAAQLAYLKTVERTLVLRNDALPHRRRPARAALLRWQREQAWLEDGRLRGPARLVAAVRLLRQGLPGLRTVPEGPQS